MITLDSIGETLDLQGVLNFSGTGEQLLIEAGTFEKMVGTATSYIDAAITSSGSIVVDSGTLVFEAGGSLGGSLETSGTSAIGVSSGVFTLALASVNADLLIEGGTLDVTTATAMKGGFYETSGGLIIAANSSESGTATVQRGYISVDGGDTLTLSGPATFGILNNSGPTLEGPGTVVTTGATDLIAQINNEIELSTGAGINWINSGTVTDAGLIQFGVQSNDATTITNHLGGVFDLTTDNAAIMHDGNVGGSTATFYNSGLLEKTGGTASSAFIPVITSSGSILVDSGTLELAIVDNLTGTGTLTGGTWEASAVGTVAGTLWLEPNLAITKDSANIILSGTNSEIVTGPSLTSIETSLVSIASAGKLQILSHRNYITTNTITDSGKIILGGGSFAPGLLTINAGALLSGFGTVAAAIKNNGTIESTGSTLTLEETITGSGLVLIGTSTDVILEAGIGSGERIKFGGNHAVLTLDEPSAVLGTLVSLSPSDTIDLVGELANSATISGDKLVVSLTAGGTVKYDLSSPNALDHLQTVSDGHGGSDIVVYSLAKAGIAPQPFNFGIRHVGDVVSEALTLSNTATPTAYGELLDASFGGTSLNSGSFTTSGTLSGLAAGASNASSLEITLGSGSAGTVAGTATIALASDGTGVDSLGTTGLVSQTITVTGTINNYATTAVQALSGPGTLSGSGTTLHLNLGSTVVGSAALTENLGVLNGAASGPADTLFGSFGLSGSTLYTDTGFGTFSGLTAGGTADTAPTISLGTGTAGTFAETIVVHGTGANASGYSGTVSNETIVVSGTITAAPMTFIAATPAAPQTAAAPLTGAAAANAFTIATSPDANAKPEALSLLSEPAYTPSTLAAAGHAATDLTPHPEGMAHNAFLAPWS